jgi:hypothetical protein
MREVIGPQLLRIAEKGVANEGCENVLTQLAQDNRRFGNSHNLSAYMIFHVILE